MKGSDWEKAKKIFGDAIKLAPEKRLAYLDEVCAADSGTRREVESLLSSYDDAESFMETPAVEVETKSLEKGVSFAHYEIIKQIGAGGMGEVYLAQDTRLDRLVAVKVLNEKYSRHKSNLNRFIREAKAASALNHPNILVIHEIGESKNTHYIVSEFINGKTLREIFKEKPLKPEEVLDIAVQIANALAAAHEAHLVHRDIKPENIIIRPDGYAKVLDFGLAKLVVQKPFGFENTTVNQNETEKGVILGTVNYMSPEQAKGERVDERTDIFSFGVLLYEMLTERTPFAGETISETFANLINKKPPPIARFAAHVPDELQRIVSKTLCKKKDERYQTMKDLLADLKSLQKRLEFESEFEKENSFDIDAETKELRNTDQGFLPKQKSNPPAAPLTPANTNTENSVDKRKSVKQNSKSEDLNQASRAAKTIRSRKFFYTAGLVILIIAIGFGYYFRSGANTTSNRKKTLAVLPFVNGGDPNAEILSDGIAESIRNNLAQISNLTVKSNNSAFRFKNNQTDTRTIASQLNVETLVTGEIKQIGDKYVINVRLINAADDSQIWGYQYVKTLTDIIAVQNEIAQKVTDNLRIKLTDAEKQRLIKKPTENFEAYRLYLRGRAIRTQDPSKAIDYYQQAIDIDPNYALAYVGLVSSYRVMMLARDAKPEEMLPKAKDAATRALELDDGLAEAHIAFGSIAFFNDWNWNEAEKSFLRGIQLDPDSSDAHLFYGHLLSNLGRDKEALVEVKRAIELDPLDLTFSALEGQFLFYAGKHDEAADQLKKTRDTNPDFWMPHLFLSRVYIEKGMFREAIDEATKARDLSKGNTEAISYIGCALAKSGDKEQARKVLEELLKLSAEKYVPPYNIAPLYNALGETNKAFEWLEKGVQAKDVRMTFLKVDPRWNNLRSDPRFIELMRRIGL